MTLSMYQASVPVFTQLLKALSGVLAKGEANAAERKITPEVFINARLSPDMYALARQVQIATDQAKGASSRLAGREPPRFEDTETTFAELRARIDKTLDYLKTLKPDEFEGSDDRIITMKIGANDMSFPGSQYLLHFAMPNFYFHVSMAYGILRHNGVPLAKSDFVGGR